MATSPEPRTPGRRVDVAPERLEGWLAGFVARHGVVTWSADEARVVVHAADGATATCEVPFIPLRVDPRAPYGGLVAHARGERTVGVLLVRLGGHAAGWFRGERLLGSKVGRRHVQARSAAGGWSQQRFARRRGEQARAAYLAAADAAAQVLLPVVDDLDAVVVGGDRRGVAVVLGDPRLGPLRTLVTGRHLDVPDPRRRVLEASPALFRAVRVWVTDPDR